MSSHKNRSFTDVFGLPSPVEVCGTPLSRRYQLIKVESLDPEEWEEVPTRPFTVTADRER